MARYSERCSEWFSMCDSDTHLYMTDASKRGPTEVSSPCHHMSQVPVTPPRGSENSFPPGITSLEMWGNTVVEFGKFKGSRNQHQLTTLNECVHTGWLHTRSPLQIKTWLERQCTRWRISSVQTVEHQSTQAAHQYTRRNISAQSGTWLNWLTDRQCISALDTTELSIHWLTETEWTKDLNFKCSDMTHKWNHDSCTY